MNYFTKLDRYDAGLLAVLLMIFGAVSKVFFWFTLDDAYITLRYSKHLANGVGIVWNLGVDPVEGYTSFLWVVVGAIPHAIGLPPVLFVKAIGVLSTALALAVLYWYSRLRSVNKWLTAAGCAQIAVSPAVAVLSVQGMETTTSMLFVLVASIAAIEVIREYRSTWAIVLNVSVLLGMFTRPDLVVFAVLLEAGLAGLLHLQGRQSEIIRLVLIGFVLVFVPGVVYMIARYWYFGYWLPNPFYIKSGLSLIGPVRIFKYVMLLLGPLLFVTLSNAVMEDQPRDTLLKLSPIFMAITGFLGIYVFITPIQGFLMRFQIPVFATTLLLLLLALDRSSVQPETVSIHSDSSTRILLVFLLVSGLFVYPLFTAPSAINQTEARTQGDRVVMGKALHSLADENLKMFVTESGAIPYYSEWTAVDALGLNSERIAHQRLSQEFLKEYNPDLIQMLVTGRPGLIRAKSPVTAEFISNSSYALVAVVHKQNRDRTNVHPDVYHIYFVDKNSEAYRKIACTLLTQDLGYGSRSLIRLQSSIEFPVANITASDCSTS